MTILFTEPSFVPVSGNSVVYPGAKLYFYETGTSTPQNTYSEYTLTTAHANPVVADADGRFAPIYLDPSLEDYKVVLKDSSDVTIWTVDPYSAGSITANADTISALLSVDGSINPNVQVNGYHSAGDGGGGLFYWDASQDKANHNGGTIIDPDITFPSDWTNQTQVTTWFAATGVTTGCWIRVTSKKITPEIFGCKGDGTTNDSIAFNQMLTILSTGAYITSDPTKNYNLGTITGNSTKFDVTSDLVIDLGGATLTCTGENDTAYTDTILFKFTDCVANITNFVFNDTAFNLSAGPSRGVAPVVIHNAAANTYNHVVKGHVINGQSLLTVTSGTPNTYRAKGITLVATGESVYYGLNTARNGDDVFARYHVDSSNRAYFAYGVDNHDVRFSCTTGDPASSNLFISHANSATAANNTDTSNLKVRAKFGTLDGPINIVDQPRDTTTGAGVYKNIDVEVTVDAIGSNLQATASTNNKLINIGALTTGSAYITTEITQTIQDLRVSILPASTINTDGVLTDPVEVHAASPNYGTFDFPIRTGANITSLFPENAGGDTFRCPVVKSESWFVRAINGALTDGAGGVSKTLYIPLKSVIYDTKNYQLALDVQIWATRAGGSGIYTMADYFLLGNISSTGVVTITSAFERSKTSTGGITPTVAFAAADPYSLGVNDHISVTLVDSSTTTGYNNAFAQLVAKVKPCIA